MLFGWVGQSHLRIKVTALQKLNVLSSKVNKPKGIVEVAWLPEVLHIVGSSQWLTIGYVRSKVFGKGFCPLAVCQTFKM